MKNLIRTTVLIVILSFSIVANAQEPAHRLITVNAEVAKAAVASFSEGYFRFIQDGKLIEAYDVDESKPSCILETGKLIFNPEDSYILESVRSLDADSETGEIELNFETHSVDPESYFQIYCYQGTPAANIDTAREGLKTIFEIE